MGKPKGKETTWKTPRTDVRTIIKWILKRIGREFLDRTDLAQECDKHGAVVNAIMNLCFPQNVRNYLAS